MIYDYKIAAEITVPNTIAGVSSFLNRSHVCLAAKRVESRAVNFVMPCLIRFPRPPMLDTPLKFRNNLFALLAVVLLAASAHADVMTKTVQYRDGDTTLEGFVAWDSNLTDAPGVLVVHQWMGLTDYEKGRCKQLAELGYVAFALDIYGTDKRPANRGEAGKIAGGFKKDRQLYRRRLTLGLDQLRAVDGVDKARIGAVGYCFGGTGVLELARSGADIQGVVSFHGGLDSPEPADGAKIKAKLLICHGADDPFVPAKDIEAMKKEFNSAKVDWQMNYYSGAVHAFTQPMAGSDNSKGAAYNKQADQRSWSAMSAFFEEIFNN